MITIREIADDKTSISSTRWAFATVIKFDIFMIVLSFMAFLGCHLIKKPLDISFFYAVGALLGILTTLVATPKALQGFEPKKKEKTEDYSNVANKETMQNDGK